MNKNARTAAVKAKGEGIDFVGILSGHFDRQSGKTILNKSFLILIDEEHYMSKLYELVRSIKQTNSKTCYVCLSRPYKDVLADMEKNKIDNRQFFFIDVLSSYYEKPEPARNCIFLDSPSNLGEIKKAVERAIEKEHCGILFFDTLSSMLLYQENFPIIRFVHNLTVEKGKCAMKIFIALKKDSIPEKEIIAFVGDLKMFADNMVELG